MTGRIPGRSVCLALLALSAIGAGQQDDRLLLVSLSAEDRVVSIRPETGELLGWYATGPGPHEIVVSADARRAYVANAGAAQDGPRPRFLSVLDLEATAPIEPLDLGRFVQPHDVRVSRDGSIVWAAVAPSQGVVELDSARLGETRLWDTGADGGWFVEVTADARKIYVPHLEGRRVTVFDRTTGGRRTVYEGGAQSGIALRPGRAEVWVVDHERRRISVVDTGSDVVAATVPLASADFGRIAFTPDGRFVALVQGRRLGWIDASARQEVTSVVMPLAGKVPAISPDGRRLAVSNPANDSVTVVELPSLRVIAWHLVGRTPDGVAWVR